MTTILVDIGLFLGGGFVGMCFGAMLAAAGRADDRSGAMCIPAAAIGDQISSRLVRDFHVVRDADGSEHIVPTDSSLGATEGGSPPAG